MFPDNTNAREFSNRTNNPYKDGNGRWITSGLFWELSDKDKTFAKYCLYEDDIDVDGKVYISLRKAYLEMEHIPGFEYEFANVHLGGWQHWLCLQRASNKLKAAIESWRDELEIKIKARSAKEIIGTALDRGAGASAFQANKWLSDKGWAAGAGKGRPKKEDIQREAKIAAGVEAELQDDLARIRAVK
jgi:hypothetical protein